MAQNVTNSRAMLSSKALSQQKISEPSVAVSDANVPKGTGPGIMDSLARLPAQSILDEKVLSTALDVTPRTIRRMVRRHELPPGVPFAGKTVWLAGKILSFLEGKLEQAAKEAEREAMRLKTLT